MDWIPALYTGEKSVTPYRCSGSGTGQLCAHPFPVVAPLQSLAEVAKKQRRDTAKPCGGWRRRIIISTHASKEGRHPVVLEKAATTGQFISMIPLSDSSDTRLRQSSLVPIWQEIYVYTWGSPPGKWPYGTDWQFYCRLLLLISSSLTVFSPVWGLPPTETWRCWTEYYLAYGGNDGGVANILHHATPKVCWFWMKSAKKKKRYQYLMVWSIAWAVLEYILTRIQNMCGVKTLFTTTPPYPRCPRAELEDKQRGRWKSYYIALQEQGRRTIIFLRKISGAAALVP